MPARDNRYSQVGVGPAGDPVFARTYSGGRDYSQMSKDELQALLKHMGLPVSGNKDELVERIETGTSD